MILEFKTSDEINIKALQNYNEELKEILECLDNGTVLSEMYTLEQFAALIKSFVEGQRGSLGNTKEGSWSIVPNDYGMPGDARVEFIFFPTYLVTAILSRTLCEFPLLAISIPGYEKALKDGMLFCSYRGLYGHGYDADKEAAEALTILSMGKVPWLLEKDPSFCPELYESIEKVTKEMQERLEIGNAYDLWGGDLQESFSSALETLYIKNDPEMYEAIINADKDSDFIKEEDLQW